MVENVKNVLFIVVDCLRADFIYDSGKSHIPNISTLKEKGFSFLNTIATTTTTTPSFSSMLTGLYPFENGVRSHSGYALNKKIVTCPEILRQKGYNTYAEITGPVVQEIGFDKGFNEFNYRERTETIHTSWGENLLKKFKTHFKEPWFVLLHIWALHHPRRVLKEMNNEQYGKSRYARAIASIDYYIGKVLKLLKEDTTVIITGDHGESITHSKIERYSKKLIVKIIQILKKYRILKIPYAKMIRPIHVGHGYNVYDHLVKVPLIFYNPNIIPHAESTIQIRHIDIFPTILDLLKIPLQNDITGKSLLPIMKGEKLPHRDAYLEAVGINIPNKEDWLAGIRVANRYKYIYAPFRKKKNEELYLLIKDPHEKHNVAKFYPTLVDELRRKIESLKFQDFVGERLKKEEQEKVLDRLQALGYID